MTSHDPLRRGARRAAAAVAALGLLAGASGCASAHADTGASASASASAASGATGVPAVVDAATAFLATLDEDQYAQAALDLTEENATAWSNLPCGSTCRVGVALGDLDDEQLDAASALLTTALGTVEGSGFDRVRQIMAADEYLSDLQASGSGSSGPTGGGSGAPTDGASGAPTDVPTDGGSGAPGDGGSGAPADGGAGGGTDSGYSSGNYYLAALGTPSTDGTWQLHFGGHHLAVNITYSGGIVTGTTPFFVGVEPTSFTADDGTDYAPLEDMRDAMLAMLGGLDEDELAAAELSEFYDDVLVGPGEDGQFPETKAGLAVSSLTEEQQDLVLAAMLPWVAVADDATADAVMARYEDELDETYVAWSGGTGLDAQANYVRIDGPSVWIEFVCQNGVVLTDQIHYHTVYRDHVSDYGGEFAF